MRVLNLGHFLTAKREGQHMRIDLYSRTYGNSIHAVTVSTYMINCNCYTLIKNTVNL